MPLQFQGSGAIGSYNSRMPVAVWCLLQGLALICMCRPVSDVVKIETQSDWGYSLGTTEWKGATGHIAGKEVQPLSKS